MSPADATKPIGRHNHARENSKLMTGVSRGPSALSPIPCVIGAHASHEKPADRWTRLAVVQVIDGRSTGETEKTGRPRSVSRANGGPPASPRQRGRGLGAIDRVTSRRDVITRATTTTTVHASGHNDHHGAETRRVDRVRPLRTGHSSFKADDAHKPSRCRRTQRDYELHYILLYGRTDGILVPNRPTSWRREREREQPDDHRRTW